jgi:hypothetical protein
MGEAVMTGQQQIEELRAAYGAIERMDPSHPLYENLINALDLLDTPKLQMLADAQIKWVSTLARNRVMRRAMSIK